ncbi:MAG: YqjK-like family protein [Thiobacillaceae bacterium]|nr:YqjK-like family protein [Thiobacillaceae bacterium]
MEPWRARLALVDRGVNVVRYVRRHPALLAGAALLLVALRPQHAVKWLQRGWLVWQVGRRLR